MRLQLIILILVVFQMNNAAACSIISIPYIPSVQEKFDVSTLVVIAQVHSTRIDKKRNKVITKFRVEQSWKGEPEKWIYGETDYLWNCGELIFDFEEGKKYLLYLNPVEGKACYSMGHVRRAIVEKTEEIDAEVALLGNM